MKEFTSILLLDHGTLDRYFLKTYSEVDFIHIQINGALSIFFSEMHAMLWSAKGFFRTSPDYACTKQDV